MPPLNLTQSAIGACVQHELLVWRRRRAIRRQAANPSADEAIAKANHRIESLEDTDVTILRRPRDARPSAARAQGQGCLFEYGTPKTAARAADGSALRTTTSSTSAERMTWVNSR